MYIREIRIEKYRHLTDVTIVPPKSGATSSAIVLAGPNGSGKSSVLEVIAMALANSFSMPFGQHAHPGLHAFEVDLGITEHEAVLIGEAVSKQPQSFVKEEVERFATERQYTRYFNREPENRQTHLRHEQAHNLVQFSLRGGYGRPVGFSIRADRYYPRTSFTQQTLLQQRQDPVARNQTSAYQLPEFQYRDMLDFLIECQYHHLLSVGRHFEGGGDPQLSPRSPIEPFNDLFERLMPGYSITTLPTENAPTNLYVRIPGGEIIPFSDMSSGEREVFFVLANFIRQDVSDAIITVDEPELHLHPELSRRLVRIMLDIKPGNQLWMATHSGEVFDEVGRDRTFFVIRDQDHGAAVRPASESSEAELLLREMFGYAGYIGVARSLLFLEGEEASLDRRVFSRLFPSELSEVKLVPAGGVDTVSRLNSAVLKIIEGGLGWMQFYALRDRDYLTQQEVEHYNSHPTGHLRVLQRCHIENYLLNDEILATVMTTIFERVMDADNVRKALRQIAIGISAEVLSKIVAFRLQRRTWPEDFALNEYSGVSLFNKDGTKNEGLILAIHKQCQNVVEGVRGSIDDRLASDAITALVDENLQIISTALALDDGGGSWRHVFPGKRLITGFAKQYAVDPIALQNSVLSAMSTQPDVIPSDLRDLVRIVAAGGRLVDQTD